MTIGGEGARLYSLKVGTVMVNWVLSFCGLSKARGVVLFLVLSINWMCCLGDVFL
jgi:hypothetical protein